MVSGLNCAMFARGGFRKSGSLRFSGFGHTLIFGEVDASKIYRRSRGRVSGMLFAVCKKIPHRSFSPRKMVNNSFRKTSGKSRCFLDLFFFVSVPRKSTDLSAISFPG